MPELTQEFFQTRLKARTTPWQEIVTDVLALHAKFVADGASQTYKQTGLLLGYTDGSFVAKCHLLAEYRGREEIWQARSFPAALAGIATLRAKAGKKQTRKIEKSKGGF